MCTVRALSETQEEATAEATLLAPIESSLSMTMAFLLKEDILNQPYPVISSKPLFCWVVGFGLKSQSPITTLKGGHVVQKSFCLHLQWAVVRSEEKEKRQRWTDSQFLRTHDSSVQTHPKLIEALSLVIIQIQQI